MMGGLLGMGPGILLFARIAKAGHGAAVYMFGGVAVVGLAFGLTAMALARLTLRLVPKP